MCASDVIISQCELTINSGSTLLVCKTCLTALKKKQVPSMSRANGFFYPSKPDLPALDPITERLVSPRLPFMQLRRLRYDGHAIIGQIINIPVDVPTMVSALPRQLDDDYAFNVNIKKHLLHKSVYLSGLVKKSVIKTWLEFLSNQPLYRMYNIKVDWSRLTSLSTTTNNVPIVLNDEVHEDVQANPAHTSVQHAEISHVNSINTPDSELLIARQHTLLWDETHCLDIAPGQNSTPLNLIFDQYAEELSFPAIYYGVPRTFKESVQVTPYMIANSEIRRRDRRGVTPQHILYMAMKVLRLRVVDGIYKTFKSIDATKSITRAQLEDRQFIQDCIDHNFAFLKSLPNSAMYWQSRRNDLFAMIRQLGKPTMFLTVSANEIRWPHLLYTLHRMHDDKQVTNVTLQNVMTTLTASMRSRLVADDPVTCCVYFHKLVSTLMKQLQSKQRNNPFGKYRVKDYFLRIEFQHRGSPHAHILLWLENDPQEDISEDMPQTVDLITTLCSVSSDYIGEEKIKNQVHRHTFTCFKGNEDKCRFNIPYWPMRNTQILLPMSKDDTRKPAFQTQAVRLKKLLETHTYDSIDEFLSDNSLTDLKYLNIIRASLRRPIVAFKREMTDIYTNTFHPWISSVLNSNMDLQFILDAYSCAHYVVEYVNKSTRGMSNLHRELLNMHEQHPDKDHGQLLRQVSLKLLNSVEMSAQEGAWYLLRQPMSHCSRAVIYIPTTWPQERPKTLKRATLIAQQGIPNDSTDIWTKNLIQHYETRPHDLHELCLADFAAWYAKLPEPPKLDEVDDCPAFNENATLRQRETQYRRRVEPRVIRYRHYDIEDTINYRREMVTLFYPFRNEMVDVLDRHRFLDIYTAHETAIMAKRQEYEHNLDITALMEELQKLYEDENTAEVDESASDAKVMTTDDVQDNVDDIEVEASSHISAVRNRDHMMSKQAYCDLMRLTNFRQREFLLEFVHRIYTPGSKPIQVFMAGPAGSGKTFTLKLLMETINRMVQQHNSLKNAYVACASTGKAALNLNGTTVHSAFKITPHSKRIPNLSAIHRQHYHRDFAGVKAIIVDEISMIGSDLFHCIDRRLRDITGVYDQLFGGLHIVFCGDFRQLPPVNARPIYKGSRDLIHGTVLWQSLDYFPLSQVMRQSDEQFSTILTKIGNGNRLTEEELKLIESRFRTPAWCNEHVPHAIRLFHRNSSVDAYNQYAIQTEITLSAEDVITGYRNTNELSISRQKLHKMSTVESGGLPYLLQLAIGAPYMLTGNIDVCDGLVNGAIGTLRHIEYLPHHECTNKASSATSYHHSSKDTNADKQSSLGQMILWLEFADDRIGKLIRLKKKPHIISKSHLFGETAFRWTPISARNAAASLGGNIRYKRRQFPLVPAAAITIHKSQGATFDQVVFEYDKAQPTSLVYVAISRVTSVDGLYLTNAHGNTTFYHGAGSITSTTKELHDEHARLQQHPLQTLTKHVQHFLTRSSTDVAANCTTSPTIVITNLNAQSLPAHAADIDTDQCLQQCDYLALTETWMTPTTLVELKGFELKTYANNTVAAGPRVAGGVAIYRNTKGTTDSCHNETPTNNLTLASQIGDVCHLQIMATDSISFILVCVYIHPNVSRNDIQGFLRSVFETLHI